MQEMLASFKKEFDEKYPVGATYEEISEFCEKHEVFKHPNARKEFIAYINRNREP